MLIIVVMKSTASNIEETPARCKEKTVRSMDAPAWATLPARRGYRVHPAPVPPSTIGAASSSRRDGGGMGEE